MEGEVGLVEGKVGWVEEDGSVSCSCCSFQLYHLT